MFALSSLSGLKPIHRICKQGTLSGENPSSGVGFAVISDWEKSHYQSDEFSRTAMARGKNIILFDKQNKVHGI